MGTAVMKAFAAGCVAGALVSCGGGSEPPMQVCSAGDRRCQDEAVTKADYVCRLMPSGHLLYIAEPLDEAGLREELERLGQWTRNGNEWIEGEGCE